jgi:hypothetical protein
VSRPDNLGQERIADGTLTPLAGYQQLTVSNVAIALTVPVGARVCLIQNESVVARVARWRDDGTNPTASTGMRLLGGNGELYYTGNLVALKFIRETGNDAVLNISYYS